MRDSYLLTPAERYARQWFCIASYALLLTIIPAFAWMMESDRWGISLGAATWFVLLGTTLRFFMVSVPEVCGLVTVNYFTGEMHAYGTGLAFRFPWELIRIGSYINLRKITQSFGTSNERSETYPAKDGPTMIVKWSFQYMGRLELLPNYIAVDKSTVDEGLKAIGSSFLSGEIGSLNADEIKGGTNHQDLENRMRDHFEIEQTFKVNGVETEGTIEKVFGIDIILINLSDIDFSPEYQKARENERIVKKVKDTSNILAENGSMTPKEAYDRTLVTTGIVKKTEQVFEVGENLGLVAKAVGKAIADAIMKKEANNG